MNGYDKLLKVIRSLHNSPENIFVSIMESANSCTVNDLPLGSEDLLISEHLTTGWMKSVNEYMEPLKKGDTVLLIKLNESTYVVLERLVIA